MIVLCRVSGVGDWHPGFRASAPFLTAPFIAFTGYFRGSEPAGAVNLYAVLSDRPAKAYLIRTVEPHR
jgi:hypothetical protein